MDTTILTVKQRTLTGKGFARKSRVVGYIPAVLYGKDMENLNIAVKPKEVTSILKSRYGKNSLIELAIEGRDSKFFAMIKDYQLHPVKRTLLHCDFIKVEPEKELLVKVPVRRIGRSEGEKAGGVLDILAREIFVKCKPKDIPSEIELSVEALKEGEVIRISEILLPEGVKAVYTKDFPVVAVKRKKRLEGEVTPGAIPGEVGAPVEGEEKKERAELEEK